MAGGWNNKRIPLALSLIMGIDLSDEFGFGDEGGHLWENEQFDGVFSFLLYIID